MMMRERLHDYDDQHRDHADPAVEGTPGKHTLTEGLQGPALLIRQSVGQRGSNQPRDVGAVQAALARHGHSPGPIDRSVGPRTIGAIRAFQGRFMERPDGLVEPGGRTQRELAARDQLPRSVPHSSNEASATSVPEVAHEPQAQTESTTTRDATREASTATAGERPPEQPAATPVSADDTHLRAASDALLAVVPDEMRPKAQLAIPVLLASCRDQGVRDPNQVAYILATAQHESGFGKGKFKRSEPLTEDHNPYKQNPDGTWTTTVHTTGKRITAPSEAELERKYWDIAYGHKLGNRPGTDDGADFKGRGYAQLTGRDNYAAASRRMNAAGFTYTFGGVTYGGGGPNPPVDLVANPTHVNLVPEVAAYIVVSGSSEGTFTGRSLGTFVHDDRVDFYNARSVINGDKAQNGAKIANIATRFAAALAPTWSRVFTPTA